MQEKHEMHMLGRECQVVAWNIANALIYFKCLSNDILGIKLLNGHGQKSSNFFRLGKLWTNPNPTKLWAKQTKRSSKSNKSNYKFHAKF